jgi:ribosomal protein L19E
VDVQVQRRAKALDQRHGAGEPCGAREARLLQQSSWMRAITLSRPPQPV